MGIIILIVVILYLTLGIVERAINIYKYILEQEKEDTYETYKNRKKLNG